MQPTQQAAVHVQNEGSQAPHLVRASFVFWGVQEEIKGKGKALRNMQPTQQAAMHPPHAPVPGFDFRHFAGCMLWFYGTTTAHERR